MVEIKGAIAIVSMGRYRFPVEEINIHEKKIARIDKEFLSPPTEFVNEISGHIDVLRPMKSKKWFRRRNKWLYKL